MWSLCGALSDDQPCGVRVVLLAIIVRIWNMTPGEGNTTRRLVGIPEGAEKSRTQIDWFRGHEMSVRTQIG